MKQLSSVSFVDVKFGLSGHFLYRQFSYVNSCVIRFGLFIEGFSRGLGVFFTFIYNSDKAVETLVSDKFDL